MASPLLSVAEALERVLADTAPLRPRRRRSPKPAAAYWPSISRRYAPAACDVSAMDGYAVRAADVASVPARLKVIGEVAAGRPFARRSGPARRRAFSPAGSCREGADTIVIQEVTRRDGEVVEVQKPAASGRHVRGQGLDFRAGEVLLAQRSSAQPRATCNSLPA